MQLSLVASGVKADLIKDKNQPANKGIFHENHIDSMFEHTPFHFHK